MSDTKHVDSQVLKALNVTIIETVNGVEIRDPFRAFECDQPKRKQWLEQQNTRTEAFLKQAKGSEAIASIVSQIIGGEERELPQVKGQRQFFRANNGNQEQNALYVIDKAGAKPRLLLDPNLWSNDGSISLVDILPSPDGSKLLYSSSFKGSRQRPYWRLLDVTTGMPLADNLDYLPMWSKSSKGFFYGLMPNTKPSIYYHRVGTDRSDDSCVASSDQPGAFWWPLHTEHERFLLFGNKQSGGLSTLWMRDTAASTNAFPLLDGKANLVSVCALEGDNYYLLVGGAEYPTRRLVTLNLQGASANHPPTITEVIPAQANMVMKRVLLIGDRLLVEYQDEGASKLKVFNKAGGFLFNVRLPALCTINNIVSDAQPNCVLYSFGAAHTGLSVRKLNLVTGKQHCAQRSSKKQIGSSPWDSSPFTIKRVHCLSKDGNAVPIYIVHRKDIKLDGQNKLVLMGYGGFGMSYTPGGLHGWHPIQHIGLALGYVLTFACLRGGGEKGETWHEIGKKEHKQDVFDDFFAASQWLISNGYTSEEKLCIIGSSNGGLLINACLTQRPSLFGAAVSICGLSDMLRYDQASSNAASWRIEYGSSSTAAEFEALFAYSPVHNVKKDIAYPPTLIVTADGDDVVAPWHSYKMTAALQAAQIGKAPILLYEHKRVGHSIGVSKRQAQDHHTKLWTFISSALNSH